MAEGSCCIKSVWRRYFVCAVFMRMPTAPRADVMCAAHDEASGTQFGAEHRQVGGKLSPFVRSHQTLETDPAPTYNGGAANDCSEAKAAVGFKHSSRHFERKVEVRGKCKEFEPQRWKQTFKRRWNGLSLCTVESWLQPVPDVSGGRSIRPKLPETRQTQAFGASSPLTTWTEYQNPKRFKAAARFNPPNTKASSTKLIRNGLTRRQ